MLLLFTCSPKKWIVGAWNMLRSHIGINCTLCIFFKEISSLSVFIAYHLYYYGGEDRIFDFSSVSFFYGASIILTVQPKL